MFFTKPWADALIVLVVVLLFFGPKRLPDLGRSLGQGMREFKDSITGHSKSSDEEERPALTETAVPPVTPPAPEPQSAEVGSGEPRA